MDIVKIAPNLSGAYPPLQSWNGDAPPDGYALIPAEFEAAFCAHNGFVIINVEGDVVASIEPNIEAWEAWKAELPELSPEPRDPLADLEQLVVDQEYRITLLELGVM